MLTTTSVKVRFCAYANLKILGISHMTKSLTFAFKDLGDPGTTLWRLGCTAEARHTRAEQKNGGCNCINRYLFLKDSCWESGRILDSPLTVIAFTFSYIEHLWDEGFHKMSAGDIEGMCRLTRHLMLNLFLNSHGSFRKERHRTEQTQQNPQNTHINKYMCLYTLHHGVTQADFYNLKTHHKAL